MCVNKWVPLIAFPSVNDAAWITICLVVVVTINMFGAGKNHSFSHKNLMLNCFVGAYGECEFIFASIKVITITALIILGIVLDLGGGPSHDRIGFRYWKNPGPFAQYNGIAGVKGQFLGWWAVMTQAAFSFIGTEIVAVRIHVLPCISTSCLCASFHVTDRCWRS